MKHFGYFVTESTRHMSEYVPYFRTNPEVVKDFKLGEIAQDLLRRVDRQDNHYKELIQDAESPELLSVDRSDEYACRIIEAMETGRPTKINGNVKNSGLITNLPEGSCVEVPCMIDGLGIHPMYIGDLPPQCASLSRANVAVQEMATSAVLERSKEAAFHAVALDPLTAAVLSLDEIRAIIPSPPLGCVDICIILDICQQLRFRRNNGQRCLSSFVGSPGCTSDGKPNVSGSSMLSYGLRGLAHNGGCCHQSTVNGTSVYKRFARWCDHGVWERIHQHFVDDPDMEYLIIDSTVVRAHPSAAGAPQKRGASIPSPWS